MHKKYFGVLVIVAGALFFLFSFATWATNYEQIRLSPPPGQEIETNEGVDSLVGSLVNVSSLLIGLGIVGAVALLILIAVGHKY